MEMEDPRFNDDPEAAGEFETSADDGRGNWGRHIEFVLATIGFAVGLGNVWCFPYLCQKNGGGTFLIPYFLCLAIAGIPIFFLELGIRQRLRRGFVACWNEISPYLGGVGIASMIVSFLVAIYYNMIICWSFYYTFVSLQEKLPYQENQNETNTSNGKQMGSNKYYWHQEKLDISSDISDSGGLLWHLCICLLLVAWVIVFCVMTKRLAVVGKVAGFTSISAYVVPLFIFLMPGLTVEGAVEVKNMFESDENLPYKLLSDHGGPGRQYSYNHDISSNISDSGGLLWNLCSFLLLAWVIVFCVIVMKGLAAVRKVVYFIAVFQHVSLFICLMCDLMVEKVAFGVERLFIPSAVAPATCLTSFIVLTVHIPLTHFWAILIFMMLITIMLGLGILFLPMEEVVDVITGKLYIAGAISIVAHIIGLAFCKRYGVCWFEVLNNYPGTILLLIIAFFALIGVARVYGVERFVKDIRQICRLICWKYVTAIFIITIFMACVIGNGIGGTGNEGSVDMQLYHEPDDPVSFRNTVLIVVFLAIISSALAMYFGYFRNVRPIKRIGADDVSYFPQCNQDGL